MSKKKSIIEEYAKNNILYEVARMKLQAAIDKAKPDGPLFDRKSFKGESEDNEKINTESSDI